MYIITHRLKSPSEFMDRYLPDGPAGGFFLPEKLGMKLGSRVCLELVFAWVNETYFLYCSVERVGVSWDNCGRVEKGCVARLDPQEAPLRDELLEQVRLSAGDVRERGPDRRAADLHVQFFDAHRRPRAGQLLDVSPTGAFIRAPRPLPTGSELHLRFQDRRMQIMRHVRGRVVRLDFSRGVAGMGVEFNFPTRRERRAMATLCDHLDRAATTASAPPR
jgi:hypothetical protein